MECPAQTVTGMHHPACLAATAWSGKQARFAAIQQSPCTKRQPKGCKQALGTGPCTIGEPQAVLGYPAPHWRACTVAGRCTATHAINAASAPHWCACTDAVQAHDKGLRHVTFTHNASFLFSCDDTGVVRIFKSNLAPLQKMVAHQEACRAVAIAPSDVKFVTCSDDQSVKVWDLATCVVEKTFTGETAGSGAAVRAWPGPGCLMRVQQAFGQASYA